MQAKLIFTRLKSFALNLAILVRLTSISLILAKKADAPCDGLAVLLVQAAQLEKMALISYTKRKLGNSRTTAFGWNFSTLIIFTFIDWLSYVHPLTAVVAVVLLFKCKITNWLRDQLLVGSITQCMFEEHCTVIIITDVTDSNPSLKKAFTLSSNRAGRLQGGRKEMRL